MQPRNKKQKGRRLVIHLLEIIRERVDKSAYEVSGSGAGTHKGDIYLPAFDIVIEAKNSEQINLIKDWEQAKSESFADNIPVLAIRNPKKPEFDDIIIAMGFGDWLDLLAGSKEKVEVVGSLDYNIKYDLLILINQCKKVIKKLEK